MLTSSVRKVHPAPVVAIQPSKPRASLVDVTPKQAEAWLASNRKNRRLRQRQVDAYARDMAAGNWQVTGEAIQFAENGDLINGQHRLTAVVQSGVTVPMFVVRGLNAEAMTVLDSGAKRTSSDALALTGHKHTALLAAIARMALTVSVHGYATVGKATFTHSEICEFIDEHPELQDYAALASAAARQIDASGTCVGYAMWRLFSIDPDDAADFFDKATTGVNVEPGDPILTMVKRFAEARRHRETLGFEATLSIIFRTWNARRNGKTLARIPVSSRNGDVLVPEPV